MVVPHFLNVEFFESELPVKDSVQKKLPLANSPLFFASIHDSTLLTYGEDVNKVYDLTLNIQDVDFEFEPGDTIGILPSNNAEEIEKLIHRLKLNEVADKLHKLSVSDTTRKNSKIPAHIPEYGTIRSVFTHDLDIRSPPKKMFLQALSHYTSSEEEKSKITHLCSKEGSRDYMQFISEKTDLLDVLDTFPSCQPPIEVIFENLPPLQPRPYSICSSPHTRKYLRITFSVVILDNNKRGVCSGWLEDCILGTNYRETSIESRIDNLSISYCNTKRIPFYFRKPKIRFPKDPSIPIIMIGPGTGVSPFVGFLETRLLEKQRVKEYGTTWLFFGCRYPQRDFIYQKELENFIEGNVLSRLFVCFSRQDNNDKKYVQDLIKEHGKEVIEKVLDEDAVIYICGDEKHMQKDVKAAIISCLIKFRQFDENVANEYVKNKQKSMKYLEDSWI